MKLEYLLSPFQVRNTKMPNKLSDTYKNHHYIDRKRILTPLPEFETNAGVIIYFPRRYNTLMQ